jgi:glucosylceramidase
VVRRVLGSIVIAVLVAGVGLVVGWPGAGRARGATASRASAASAAPGEHVAVYLTTGNLSRRLTRGRDLVFEPGASSGAADDITVNPQISYQTLTAGFGVAMTDSSAYLLDDQLPPGLRDQAMRQLFSRSAGIGLSFLRVPIGGSDFIVGSPYTYDDMPPGQVDPTLAHFSIAHDRPYIIPMLRQAMALNPGLSIMANPWTPPAWMKTDDKLVTSTGPLGTLIPTDYGVYAQYLVRFLQAYRAAGIRIDYLGVQNEPLTPLLFVAGIPESYLSPQDEGTLIHDNVAPALRTAGLTPRIMAYDDAFQRSEAYIPVVMSTAGADVGGLAYHCYLSDPSSMSIEHARYPQLPALETECSSELSNLPPAEMAIGSLRNWAQGIQLWNAVLNQNDGPKIGSGCQGITPPHEGQQCIAPVTVNTNTHTYTLTSDYWALAQFSKFIALGARRIDSTTPSSCPDSPASGWNCGPEDVAFQNPDGSQAVVATSNDGSPHTITVSEGANHFSYTIPDGATATFVWPAPVPKLTRLRVARRIRIRRRATVRFTLSEPATVWLHFARATSGRRAGHRCVRARGHVRRSARCTRWVVRRVVKVSGVEGANSVRLRARALRAARYRLTATATDAGGDRARPVRRRFLAVRGPSRRR